MRYLAPYQFGLWLAEYLNIRCQLCGCYRKALPSTLSQPNRLLSTSILKKSLLCTSCHYSIPWLPALFNVDVQASVVLPIQVASYYDYPIRQAIRAFKHSEDMTRLPLLVHMLRQLPRPRGCHSDNSVILPMPTTDSRLIKRGFDPVTILSIYLSKHWQIPLWHGVERKDDTLSQKGLDRTERLSNLNDAFMLIETPPVKRIILFDDVATTGSSLQALARSLLLSDSSIFDISDRSEHSSNSPLIHQPSSFSTVSASKNHKNQLDISAYALAHGSQKHK